MPSLRLDYRAPADSCPDAVDFIDLVRARLGHDPFRPDGEAELGVDIAPGDGSFAGTMRIAGADGRSWGQRELTANDCAELAETIAVATSIALASRREARAAEQDAGHRSRSADVAHGRQGTRAPPEAEAPPQGTHSGHSDVEPSPSADDPGPGLHARVLAGIGVGWLGGPSPHADFLLGAGLRSGPFAGYFTAHYADTFATSQAEGSYRLRTWMIRGRLLACYLWGPVELCPAGSVGALAADARGVADPVSAPILVGTLGGVVAASFSLDEQLGVRIAAEVAASLPRLVWRAGSEPLWTSSPVLLQLNVSFLYER